VDFRSPENLNMFLMSSEHDSQRTWPLVKIILEARYKKREAQFSLSKQWSENKKKMDKNWQEDDGFYFQVAYLSKKLYGKRVDEITNPQFAHLEKFIKDSDQIWKF
jgi:hypothetical protein